MNRRRVHYAALGPAIPVVPVGDFTKSGLTKDQWAGVWSICGPSAEMNMRGLQLWQVIASAYLEGLQHGAALVKPEVTQEVKT